ncbi:MAG: redox-sensing transcriptional repressor Rex [Peptostreptococcaceae bacterium]|nr:redox-sensing transcriptional repressor Rex [Peptostreptococcaceae bacterium]
MEKKDKVSMVAIRRLPKYYRYLKDLMDKDIEKISSKELGDIMGFTASQIRQDLNNFGGFGQQGYGYNVRELHGEVGKILGLDKGYNIVIIGAGNLGQALVNYTNFEKTGFDCKAMFDINPRLIGMMMRDIKIYDFDGIEEYIENNDIDIAFVCTNKENAQDVASRLCRAGKIRAIWNFAPTDITTPEGVIVENVHLIDSLLTVTYRIKD